MKVDSSFWKKQSKRPLHRKINNRGKPKELFLIICEGEKTEPNYFRSFHLPSAKVEPIGSGNNTMSLVNETIKMVKDASEYGIKYDQVWCVFDKDDFSSRQFNDAISLAKRNNFKVAYSNQSFELWYLLHFNYYDMVLNRKTYIRRLTQLLKRKYKKNSKDMYEKLLDKQKNALRNAKKLLKSYSPSNPAKNDPSTTVHKLVEELNKYI